MRRAFTLIEILVVVTVLAVLASLLFPLVGYFQALSARTATTARLVKVASAIDAYAQDHGRPPVAIGYRDGFRPASIAVAATHAHMLHQELASDRGGRPSGYLGQDLSPSDVGQYRGIPVLVDRWGSPLIYVSWTGDLHPGGTLPVWPGETSPRLPVGTPPANWYGPSEGSRQRFELWSAGPDGLFSQIRPSRGDGDDADNIPERTYVEPTP
ncbi:MAG: hypothetical protein RLZZ127_640 [Planctomycetota bacterium]|jgi:prepilin-type N-terminal cleavage/methylation domain-containing protein